MPWRPAVPLLALAVLLAGCGDLGPSLSLGDRYPSFEGTAEDGRRFSTDEARGRPFVVHATQAEVLQGELSAMAALAGEHEGTGILFVTAVSVQPGEAEDAGAMLEATPGVEGWVRMLDEEDRVRRAYAANLVSQVLVFGKDGRLAAMADDPAGSCLPAVLRDALEHDSPRQITC